MRCMIIIGGLIKMVKCPECNKENWRANVSQSVDVEIDNDFYPIDNGFNFTLYTK